MKDIFTKLENTSSRLEKEAILRDNFDNEDLKNVIFHALDPYTQFFIRKIPKYEQKSSKLDFPEVFHVLRQLSSRAVTGNAAIDLLRFVLEHSSEDIADSVIRIISKDLKCGVSTATVNKIWKNFIPTFPVMLAAGYNDRLMEEMQYPAYVQLKLDGMRFNAIVKDNQVEFRSRNGKMIHLQGCLEKEFIKMSFGDNVVFDGELIVKENGKILNRQTGNGILNKAVRGTISPSEAEKVCATIWDIIPIEDFKKGFYTLPYEQRYFALAVSAKPDLDFEKINVINNKVVYSEDEAREIFEEYLAQGEEGIILKNIKSPWENKRVKHQIKFKGELECDLVCVDWQEGTGKNIGKLGALVLESADGVIKVNVGTGFSDEQRIIYTKENTIGKIVAVRYNAKIKDKNLGGESLFLPVFLEIRDDKDEADLSAKIK